MAATQFPLIRKHVLLPWAASPYRGSGCSLRPSADKAAFTGIVEQVPDDWLLPVPGAETPARKRAAYVDYFLRRLEAAPKFVKEAMRAHAELL